MKIDKDIPMPDIKVKHCPHIWELRQILCVLLIGDSFIAHEKIITRSGGIKYQKTLEAQYRIRLTHRKTPEGVRVWRIA